MLNLSNISKEFKNKKVLNQLNFEIKNGECVYIHGKNGSGKSTLFKIICDIIKANAGSIIKEDNVYIGALIENPGFVENESIKFNLKFLASLNNKYNEERIFQLCNLYSLDFNSKAPIKSYSVGMRQKVGIIQAVMENQNLILFDEPTRGLDDESIEVFEKMVNSLIVEGKSVIIASHDLLKNIKYATKYLLNDGKLSLE
ncbi:MAG: ABC transporter ATP-binding protein [Erysipelotrichaceae bacterium]